MDDRQRRIEEYLQNFNQLTPQEQRIHFSAALVWIVRALAAIQVSEQNGRLTSQKCFEPDQ